METAIVHWGYIRMIENETETSIIVYGGMV